MPNQRPDDAAAPGPGSYRAWQEDAASRLPPPVLPAGRRSFGCPAGRAAAGDLYLGAGPLIATIQEMETLAGGLVSPAPAGQPRGSMPAGYTYLAQLLIHDIAQVTEGRFPYTDPDDRIFAPPTEPEEEARAGADGVAMLRRGRGRPARRPGLLLDSIFGPKGEGLTARGVYRFPPSRLDPERPVCVDLDRPGGVAACFDRRNDDTPMLAQLSALFAWFYQLAVTRLRPVSGPAAEEQARVLTVETFHRILRADLLPRLLHPDVADLLLKGGLPPVDPGARQPEAVIPVEVTNAVFRFGHSMVQPTYLLNDRSRPPTALADLMSGLPDILALRRRNANLWRVDWRLFFGDGPDVQMSRPIGPNVSPGLVEKLALPSQHEIGEHLGRWKHHLALADLSRSADGGLQSVAALAARFEAVLRTRPVARAWAFRQARIRRALVASWLKQVGLRVPAHVIADPPLLLFVLIEAGRPDRRRGGGGGRTLGALGSLIMGEVVLHEMAHAAARLAWTEVPEAARQAVFGQETPPETMPGLIEYLSLLQ